ncbi:MAG: glutathione peroxidase [Bacteroidetes bacterium]|nr:glutathione peroxidase [Bacteroidota bacterium]
MKSLTIVIPVLILLFILTNSGCSDSSKANREIKSTDSQAKEINRKGNTDLNKNIYDLKVRTMEGEEKNLSDYKGKVLLIVNVASRCGYTPQYEGLEALYLKYKEKGFEVLAFPCNDFGGQEPGTNDEIRTFCESKYNITFTLFDKIKVLGEEKSPLYARLTENSVPSGDIDWNFEKFIIDKSGNIVSRFRSKTKPESEEVTKAIETLLN